MQWFLTDYSWLSKSWCTQRPLQRCWGWNYNFSLKVKEVWLWKRSPVQSHGQEHKPMWRKESNACPSLITTLEIPLNKVLKPNCYDENHAETVILVSDFQVWLCCTLYRNQFKGQSRDFLCLCHKGTKWYWGYPSTYSVARICSNKSMENQRCSPGHCSEICWGSLDITRHNQVGNTFLSYFSLS